MCRQPSKKPPREDAERMLCEYIYRFEIVKNNLSLRSVWEWHRVLRDQIKHVAVSLAELVYTVASSIPQPVEKNPTKTCMYNKL